MEERKDSKKREGRKWRSEGREKVVKKRRRRRDKTCWMILGRKEGKGE